MIRFGYPRFVFAKQRTSNKLTALGGCRTPFGLTRRGSGRIHTTSLASYSNFNAQIRSLFFL